MTLKEHFEQWYLDVYDGKGSICDNGLAFCEWVEKKNKPKTDGKSIGGNKPPDDTALADKSSGGSDPKDPIKP